MPMATKTGRVVTHNEWPSSITPHDHLIVWSCDFDFLLHDLQDYNVNA